ncbi:hypothetical protein GCM10009843_01500 [Nocardioides bigeumensis]|uniref:Uncharacterized protein n=1 Tax=Nocardioides bigeumensis TaxID=433657 RepID=A0ABN2XMY4_9ACTN
MCDKAGAENTDVGPGGDWVCLVNWTDPEVPMPNEGYGKFELNVHSNDCYTASGPSKLTGFVTMTDTSGARSPTRCSSSTHASTPAATRVHRHRVPVAPLVHQHDHHS